MYVLKSCFLLKKDSDGTYQNYDINKMELSDIFKTFVDGFLTLTHTKLKGTFYLSLENLRGTKLQLVESMTLQDWFSFNGKYELETTKLPPFGVSTALVETNDSLLAGYIPYFVGRNLDETANIPKSEQVDILLKKKISKDNYSFLYKRNLVSVNGYLHRTVAHPEGLVVLGAGETVRNMNKNTISVWSFAKCGDVRTVDITEKMVTNTSATVPFNKELLINTGIDLTNKAAFLVLAGIPIIDNKVIKQVVIENGVIKIDTSKISLLDIILSVVGDINLDSLGVFLADRVKTANKVRVNDVLSDIALTKLFTLPQTFVVIVNANSIGVKRESVSTTGLPAVWECGKEPIYPLQLSNGRLVDYWKNESPWGWIITANDDIGKFKMNQTNIDYELETANSTSYTDGWYHDKPTLMLIETLTKTKIK